MNVLVFAPHPDDEILGCGGVMAKHVANGDEVTVCVVTSSQPPIFDNTKALENGWPHRLYPEIKKAHDGLGVKDTVFFECESANLEGTPRYKLNKLVSDLVQEIKPDVVYIPHFGDMQRDHTLVSEAVMVAVRPRGAHRVWKVLAYETLSETEWNVPHVKNVFIPNVFVDISDYLDKKLEAMKCYQSQLMEFPEGRSLEAIEALAKLRGSTMRAGGGGRSLHAYTRVSEVKRRKKHHFSYVNHIQRRFAYE